MRNIFSCYWLKRTRIPFAVSKSILLGLGSFYILLLATLVDLKFKFSLKFQVFDKSLQCTFSRFEEVHTHSFMSSWSLMSIVIVICCNLCLHTFFFVIYVFAYFVSISLLLVIVVVSVYLFYFHCCVCACNHLGLTCWSLVICYIW